MIHINPRKLLVSAGLLILYKHREEKMAKMTKIKNSKLVIYISEFSKEMSRTERYNRNE